MLPVAVPRRRTGCFVSAVTSTFALAICLWILTSSLGAARARRAARTQQRLLGFTESRQADLPTDLRALNISELLAHPLLTHPTPTCTLTPLHQARYAPLLPLYRPPRRQETPHTTTRNDLTYLVALNLFSSSTVLPSLIRALVALLTSLGPSRFHISIYENGSTDTTPAQLYLFAQLLRQLGAGFTLHSDPARPTGFPQGSRIDSLAELRNLALKPLLDAPEGTYDRVLFLNDVHLCEADLMEMMLQHEVQGADMSCGMDYKELRIKEFESQGYPLNFYDVWVARDMLGLYARSSLPPCTRKLIPFADRSTRSTNPAAAGTSPPSPSPIPPPAPARTPSSPSKSTRASTASQSSPPPSSSRPTPSDSARTTTGIRRANASSSAATSGTPLRRGRGRGRSGERGFRSFRGLVWGMKWASTSEGGRIGIRRRGTSRRRGGRRGRSSRWWIGSCGRRDSSRAIPMVRSLFCSLLIGVSS